MRNRTMDIGRTACRILNFRKAEKILIINNWKSAQKVVYLECFDSLTL